MLLVYMLVCAAGSRPGAAERSAVGSLLETLLIVSSCVGVGSLLARRLAEPSLCATARARRKIAVGRRRP